MAHYPQLTRKRVVAIKNEGTPGTAEALTASEGAYNVFDVVIAPQTEKVARDQQGSFNALPTVQTNRLGQVTFSSHLYGGSAQPTWAAALLPAVGLGFSSTLYTADNRAPGVASSTLKTNTFGVYQDGLLKSVFGAMGNATFTLNANSAATAAWTFLGKWAAPADTALIAPTYPTGNPLRVYSATATVGGWSPIVHECVIETNNTLFARPDAANTNGYSYTIITNRKVKGRLVVEATLEATYGMWAAWLAGTQHDLAVVARAGDDDATFTVSDIQFIDIADGDANGVQTAEIQWEANTDDFSILFS